MQGGTFLGQPEAADTKMALTAANHRFHDHHAFLQPHLQECRTSSQDKQEERRNQGNMPTYTPMRLSTLTSSTPPLPRTTVSYSNHSITLTETYLPLTGLA